MFQGDATLSTGPYGSAGTCIINYAVSEINVVMAKVLFDCHNQYRDTCTIKSEFQQETAPERNYVKPLMGFGSLTAAKYGTLCPAHVSCSIHPTGILFHTLQPWKTLILLCVCILCQNFNKFSISHLTFLQYLHDYLEGEKVTIGHCYIACARGLQ